MFFAENEAVVEKEVENHDDGRGEDEGAGGEDEFVGEREMDGRGDIVGEFVKRSKDAKKLSEGGGDKKSESCIPDEKADDGMFGNRAILPGDFGVRNESDDSGNACGNEVRKPEEIVVFNNEIRENSKEGIIENRDRDADEEVSKCVLASFDWCCGVCEIFGFCGFGIIHIIIITLFAESDIFAVNDYGGAPVY